MTKEHDANIRNISGGSELWPRMVAPRSTMADITVAIPTYNRKHLLRSTIESVLAQDDVDIEVFVIDNASTDGTAEFVEGLDDPRLRVVRNACNVGLVGNFNRALSAGSAPLLTVVHDDDLLRPHSLALRAELLRSDESMVVAYSDYAVIDQHGSRTREVFRTVVPSGSIERSEQFLRAALLGHVRCHMSAALMRRRLLGDVRCQAEDGSFTDHGLWMRLACFGSFGLIPLPLADIRLHTSAGAAMGNFRLDADGRVVPNATEQVARMVGVARRVLRDPALDVPVRTKLRIRNEIEATRQFSRAIGLDLEEGAGLRSVIGRAFRAQPAVAVHPRVIRSVGVRVRDRLRGRR